MTASLEPWISESEMMRGVRGVVLRGKALLKHNQKILKKYFKATDYKLSKEVWLQCYINLSIKLFQIAARIKAHTQNKQNSSLYNTLHYKS